MTDAGSGKVPVLRCVTAAWQFLFANWRLFLPAALIISAISTLAPVFLAASGSAPAAGFGALAITTVAGIFFTATVLRKAVRDEYVRPTGLGFGGDELNLLGVLGSLILVFVPPVVLFGMVLSIVALMRSGLSEAELESMSNDPEALNRLLGDAMSSPPGILLGLVCLVIIGVLVARLSMVYAATIGERRIVIFQTWPWTRGNVLRVLAAVVLTGFPAALVQILVQAFLSSILPPASGVAAITVANLVLSLVAVLLSIPPTALGAELYRGLRPPDFTPR